MSDFKPVSVGRARWLAEQFGAERIVVISTCGDRFAVTSYASTVAVCRRLGKMIDDREMAQVARRIADA